MSSHTNVTSVIAKGALHSCDCTHTLCAGAHEIVRIAYMVQFVTLTACANGRTPLGPERGRAAVQTYTNCTASCFRAHLRSASCQNGTLVCRCGLLEPRSLGARRPQVRHTEPFEGCSAICQRGPRWRARVVCRIARAAAALQVRVVVCARSGRNRTERC